MATMDISNVVKVNTKTRDRGTKKPDVRTALHLVKDDTLPAHRPWDLFNSGNYFTKLEKYPENSEVQKAVKTRFSNGGREMWVVRQVITKQPATVIGKPSLADLEDLKKITTGDFKDVVNGSVVSITGLNLTTANKETSGYSEVVVTPLKFVELLKVTAGKFKITINGTDEEVTALNFSTITGATTLEKANAVATALSTAITGSSTVTAQLDGENIKLIFKSGTNGAASAISLGAGAGDTGVDISTEAYLNVANQVKVVGTAAGPIQSYSDLAKALTEAYGSDVVVSYNPITKTLDRATTKKGKEASLGNITSASDFPKLLGWDQVLQDRYLKGLDEQKPSEALKNFFHEHGKTSSCVITHGANFDDCDLREIADFTQSAVNIDGMAGYLFILESLDSPLDPKATIKVINKNSAEVCCFYIKDGQQNTNVGAGALLSDVVYDGGFVLNLHGKRIVGIPPAYFTAEEDEARKKDNANIYSDTAGVPFIMNGNTCGKYMKAWRYLAMRQLYLNIQNGAFNVLATSPFGVPYNASGVETFHNVIVSNMDKFKANGTVEGGKTVSEVGKSLVASLYPDNKDVMTRELYEEGYLIKDPDLISVSTDNIDNGVFPPYNIVVTTRGFVEKVEINSTLV